MARRLRNQTIKVGIDTSGATKFAKDTYNRTDDIQLNWWEFFSTYRTKKWKQELKILCEKNGITVDDVGNYLGMKYSGLPGFYRKLPKTRETYIGIGMAYKLPLKTINRWLVKYGGKRKLYAKEALSDLIWIHLINANYNDKDSTENYYQKFDECRAAIEDIYSKINTEIVEEHVDTADMEREVGDLVFDPTYRELKKYVKENLAAFHSAYAKPKLLLHSYIEHILRVKNDNKGSERRWTLNTLRGYLDDSMINYLTSASNKYVPKNKRTHISIGLAVGMTVDDLDKYLNMLGYGALDGTYLDEGILINILEKWEENHPLQRNFKNKYLAGRNDICLTGQEEMEAVTDMLRLRRDLKEAYEVASRHEYNDDEPKKFPYLNE